jgi:hypothetical protein
MRAIQVGVLGTVLVHLLLLWLLPKLPWHESAGLVAMDPEDACAATFEVQLAPDAFATLPVTPPPVPPKFVEINPAAPDNAPDQTNNFAAQNQQAAQPVPTPNGQSDTPASKGDPEKTATAIVSGQLAEPRPLPVAPAPSAPPVPPSDQSPARRALTPLPGTEQAQGENPASIGTNTATTGPNPSTVTERVNGNPAATANNGFTIGLPVHIDPLHPQSRPQLATVAVRARPSPLLNNFSGTDHTGLTAYDAKWNSYGEYLQRLVDSVDVQWHRIVEQSSVYPDRGTRVEVKFRINARGEIAEIVAVGGNGNNDAKSACISGITAPAPYGSWSADMVATLGETQELTFEFYYY